MAITRSGHAADTEAWYLWDVDLIVPTRRPCICEPSGADTEALYLWDVSAGGLDVEQIPVTALDDVSGHRGVDLIVPTRRLGIRGK